MGPWHIIFSQVLLLAIGFTDHLWCGILAYDFLTSMFVQYRSSMPHDLYGFLTNIVVCVWFKHSLVLFAFTDHPCHRTFIMVFSQVLLFAFTDHPCRRTFIMVFSQVLLFAFPDHPCRRTLAYDVLYTWDIYGLILFGQLDISHRRHVI